MKGRPVGDTVRFTVRRGGREKVVALKTVAAPDKSQRAIVGDLLDQASGSACRVRVSIDAGGVGGPSAGLAFALDVLEELGQNVDRGHKIAATGEIFLNGAVGPIGGIKQKTIGARQAGVDAFLVPVGERAGSPQVRARAADHPCEEFSTGVARPGNIARGVARTLEIRLRRKGPETPRFLSWQALDRGRACVGSLSPEGRTGGVRRPL